MLDRLRGRERHVSSSENAAAMAGVQRRIDTIEKRIGEGATTLAGLEVERSSQRYARDVLKETVDISALEKRVADLNRKQTGHVEELRRQRAYLVELQRPLLESQEREALAAYESHHEGHLPATRAEMEALASYFEAKAQALSWERESRTLAHDLNRLNRRLGLPDISPAIRPMGSRLWPSPVLSGEATDPADYRVAASRLRATVAASEQDVKRAWGASMLERTSKQNDLVAFWPVGA